MPLLSRVAIRAALIALSLGAALGAWLVSARALGMQPPWALIPLHVELLLHGWLVQLAMGVAYWILPRRQGRPTERGRARAAVAAILLLNCGVLMAGLGPTLGPTWMLGTGRLLELAAAACFGFHAWPRARLVVAG